MNLSFLQLKADLPCQDGWFALRKPQVRTTFIQGLTGKNHGPDKLSHNENLHFIDSSLQIAH